MYMNLSSLSLWMAQATGRSPSRCSKRKDFMVVGTALHPCIALKRPSLYRRIQLHVIPSRNIASTSSFCTFQERSTLSTFIAAPVKRTKAVKALIVRSVLASEQVEGNHTNHESFPPSVLPELQGYGLMETGVPQPALVVFSGGTAFNSVAGHVRQLTTRVTHVLPVSDDGGSTAEIVRVLGGPAVGDIRSRCLRLADDSDAEAQAVRKLLAYRLPSQCATEAKKEWYDIVEGDHELWQGVSDPYKHTIRAFLVHFHVNILRHSTEKFNFRSGSVGNFFFAGARTFFRSLEAAIFLFSRVARIPEGSLVLPAICTEERISLAAELVDGSVLAGQNEISHPSTSSLPQEVNKGMWDVLPSPVRRIFYLSAEGDRQEHEVAPPPNPRMLHEVEKADAIIYGMGSLYTSICPSLVLRGVGEAVADVSCPKILLLNGSLDRETSTCQAHPGPMRASDVVLAITDALNRRGAFARAGQLDNSPAKYVTTVLVPSGGEVEVDEEELLKLGIQNVISVESERGTDGLPLYDPEALVAAIGSITAHQGGSSK